MKGVNALVSLTKYFDQIDVDNSGALDKQEFTAAIRELKLDVSDRDIYDLFDHFDRNGDGQISYFEFVLAIRGNMSSVRQDLVEKAFQTVDRNLTGQVDIRDLKKAYNAKNHPVVVDGRMSEH